MRTGACLLPGNFSDWERFLAREKGDDVPSRPEIPDDEIIAQDYKLHEQVEDLGFDSLWTIEHHFTPYAMVNNPLQTLTYFAARTEQIDLGTMVVVLPWHNPVRVAEEMSLLQVLMGDHRNAKIGFGRGVGRREFEGLMIDQNAARGRTTEGVEIIRQALTEDSFSFSGEHFSVPETSLRPRSVKAGEMLAENMYGSWGSPSSVPIVAGMGLKPLIIPLAPWDTYVEQLANITEIRVEAGLEPSRPVVLVAIYCAETEKKAREGANAYMMQYNIAATHHYEIGGDHFKNMPTYADYAERGQEMRKAMMETKGEDLNFVWGTPQQCVEEIERIRDLIDPSEIVFVHRYGSMPYDLAKANMDLVAAEVVPAVQNMPARSVASVG